MSPPPPSLPLGQTQLFNFSPNSQDCHTFFNLLDHPTHTLPIPSDDEFRQNHFHQDEEMVLHEGSSSNHQVCNYSLMSTEPIDMDNPRNTCDSSLSLQKMDEFEEESGKNNGHGSPKWMSSKMRLMKKMMRPSSSTPPSDKSINTATALTATPSSRFQSQGHENYRYSHRSPRNNGSNNTIRVCSDCNTSSTPLWRSGPKGPKSLCNACGIRQRKARRAMLEAANGVAATPMNNATSTKTRVHNKEKKSRSNHKNKHNTKSTTSASSSEGAVKKLECFKDYFALKLRNNNSAFQRDEVAEAALLLMELSCGLVHL